MTHYHRIKKSSRRTILGVLAALAIVIGISAGIASSINARRRNSLMSNALGGISDYDCEGYDDGHALVGYGGSC